MCHTTLRKLTLLQALVSNVKKAILLWSPLGGWGSRRVMRCFTLRNFQMCGFGVIYEIYDAYATIARFKCKVAHHAATYPIHQEVAMIGWLTLHLKRVLGGA